MKVCSMCHHNKPLNAFTRDPRCRLGVVGWCRQCRAVRTKAWAEKTKLAPKPVVVTKRCRTCNTVKPAADFPRNSASRDGFGGRCKACRRAIEHAPRMTTDR